MISKAELRQMFETSEKKDEQLWLEIFEEVDTDGDGDISYQEFAATMNKVLRSQNKSKYLVRESTLDYTRAH